MTKRLLNKISDFYENTHLCKCQKEDEFCMACFAGDLMNQIELLRAQLDREEQNRVKFYERLTNQLAKGGTCPS